MGVISAMPELQRDAEVQLSFLSRNIVKNTAVFGQEPAGPPGILLG